MISLFSLRNRCSLQINFFIIIVFYLSVLSVSNSYSANRDSLELKDISNFPEKYGSIIYNKMGEKNKRVFIIFQAHRSSLTGSNNDVTVQAQSDIYRIEEWLVRNRDVQLLLPEGYLKRKNQNYQMAEVDSGSAIDNEISIYPLDDETLKKQLSDTSKFVSADKLLYQSSNIRLRQIEDRKLYLEVYRYVSGLKGDEWSDDEKYSKLCYLQSKRNAHLLQKLPEIIETEYENGRIDSRKAIFTIGLAHAPDIIRFVEEDGISAHFFDSDDPQKIHKLNLLENGYQVTMIIPNALRPISEKFALNITDDDLDLYVER